MAALYEHPIKHSERLVIFYPAAGPKQGYPELHSLGCSHTARKQVRSSIEFAGNEAYSEDDFFMVAACARDRKAK